jgi:hypothetical protein
MHVEPWHGRVVVLVLQYYVQIVITDGHVQTPSQLWSCARNIPVKRAQCMPFLYRPVVGPLGCLSRPKEDRAWICHGSGGPANRSAALSDLWLRCCSGGGKEEWKMNG